MKKQLIGLALLAGVLLVTLGFIQAGKPVLYLVGDSTVSGGWGTLIPQFFDTTKINIINSAVAGTSSRTFYTSIVHQKSMSANGLWQGVKSKLKPGDYVIIQFGHNDDSPVADTARARGSLRGTGPDSVIIKNPFTHNNEVVHSYGWYLNKYVEEAKEKGATIIICSPIPMDKWKDNKVVRKTDSYGKWAAEVARQTGAFFIGLNNLIADRYEQEGQVLVSARYFTADHVHTSAAGSMHNATAVIDAVKGTKKLKLKKYLN